MTNTLRLLVGDWQGGNRSEYYMGAELLSRLVPQNDNQKTVKVEIDAPNQQKITESNGVVMQESVLKNVQLTKQAIQKHNPDKIITLGGTCLVSQAPFDYLHRKYGQKLGIIWIDAHPDVSNPDIFNHEHAMVLGNLLHKGDAVLQKEVEKPITPDSIFYVGLKEPTQDEKNILNELNIDYTNTQNNSSNPKDIQKWINDSNFDKIAVHLDLDVLNPETFRSIYFAEPWQDDYSVSSGKLELAQLSTILKNLSNSNEIVGLTIAEYLPWDAIALNRLLSELEIFK